MVDTSKNRILQVLNFAMLEQKLYLKLKFDTNHSIKSYFFIHQKNNFTFISLLKIGITDFPT